MGKGVKKRESQDPTGSSSHSSHHEWANISWNPYRVRVKRRGVSLIETMIVVGMLFVLIAIILPSVFGASRAARDAQCLAGSRDLMYSVSMYADDWGGAWPFPFERSASGGWAFDESGGSPASFGAHDWGAPLLASDYWYLGLAGHLDDTRLTETLACPLELTQSGDRPSYSFEPEHRIQASRRMSASMYYNPAYLADHQVAYPSLGAVRVSSVADVVFPASKAVLVEEPVHGPLRGAHQAGNDDGPDWSQTVVSVDGAAHRRHRNNAMPGVAIPPWSRFIVSDGDLDFRSKWAAFHFTRDGVRGRDW